MKTNLLFGIFSLALTYGIITGKVGDLVDVGIEKVCVITSSTEKEKAACLTDNLVFSAETMMQTDADVDAIIDDVMRDINK